MTKWPVQKPTHRMNKKHIEHYDGHLETTFFLILTLVVIFWLQSVR